MWNMAVNNISYPIYPLSTRTEKGYITKMIPFFFCSVYLQELNIDPLIPDRLTKYVQPVYIWVIITFLPHFKFNAYMMICELIAYLCFYSDLSGATWEVYPQYLPNQEVPS